MCMLHLEKACLEQEDLFYKWINDESVRKFHYMDILLNTPNIVNGLKKNYKTKIPCC